MTNNGRVDESLMQPAIVTGTQGFQIFLNGFDDGTTEVKNLLNYECDVIIECRVCRNLFRSLPSFVAHKRIYCKDSAFEQIVVDTAPNLTSCCNSGGENDQIVRPASTESCPTLMNMNITTNDTTDNNDLELEHSTSRRSLLKTYKKKSPRATDSRSENSSKNASKLTLNFLSRLSKRVESSLTNSETVYSSPLHRYAPICRIVPPTKYENGVQILKYPSDLDKLPSRERKNADYPSTVTMVLPQDAAHRQHTMALRTRRNWDPAVTVKELNAEEAKLCEKLESLGLFDVSTLTCLKENCRKSFKTVKIAVFHAMYVHTDDKESACLLCDDNDNVQYDAEALKVHLEENHDFIFRRHVNEINSISAKQTAKMFYERIFEARKSLKSALKVKESRNLEDEVVEITDDNFDVSQNNNNICINLDDDEELKNNCESDQDEEETKSKAKTTESDVVRTKIRPKPNENSSNGKQKREINDVTPQKTTWQQRELLKLSSSLRSKRVLQSPYNSAEFESSLPKRVKRSSLPYSPTTAGRSVKSASIKRVQIKREIVEDASASSNLDKFPVIFTQKQKEQALAIMDYQDRRCRQCCAIFTNRCNLERHCYMHFGYIRFKCSRCDVGSFYRTELRRHLRTSCKNMKPNEREGLDFDDANNLIVPACPEEPGRVVVQKSSGTTTFSRNFKGRQTIITKPSLKRISFISGVKKAPSVVTEDNNQQKKSNFNKPTEKIIQSNSNETTTKSSRSRKNPPKKLSLVNEKNNNNKEIVQSNKTASSAKKEQATTNDDAKKLSDIKRETNINRRSLKKYQGSFKMLAQKRTENELKIKQEPPSSGDDAVDSNTSQSSDNDEDEEEQEQEKLNINDKQTTPVKKSKTVEAGVVRNTAEDTRVKTPPVIIKQGQKLIPVMARTSTSGPPQLTVMGRFCLSGSTSTSNGLLKPSLKMFKGVDGKLYAKPFVLTPPKPKGGDGSQ